MTTIQHYPDLHRPEAFTRESLGWQPWVQPLDRAELTPRHYEGLIDDQRANFAYFRLLVRAPELLGARTRLDKDTFYNEDGGLPRADRELAAAAAFRVNGCVFCASVHARAAAQLSGRAEDVDRLLADGTGTELGERWDAIVAAAEALTTTPVAFSTEHVERLREVGLGDDEILDVVGGAAFFNWANRLMLSLGEPEVPARRRS